MRLRLKIYEENTTKIINIIGALLGRQTPEIPFLFFRCFLAMKTRVIFNPTSRKIIQNLQKKVTLKKFFFSKWALKNC